MPVLGLSRPPLYTCHSQQPAMVKATPPPATGHLPLQASRGEPGPRRPTYGTHLQLISWGMGHTTAGCIKEVLFGSAG